MTIYYYTKKKQILLTHHLSKHKILSVKKHSIWKFYGKKDLEIFLKILWDKLWIICNDLNKNNIWNLLWNIKNNNHTLNGAKLDLLTSSTYFYLSLTLCLKDYISANRTTINAMC